MKLKEQRLLRLKDEALAELRSIGIEVPKERKIRYVLNTRTQRLLGRCKKISEDNFQIDISTWIFDGDDTLIKTTLIHEILHTFPRCMNHGKVWKEFAQKVNIHLGYNVSRLASREKLVANMGEDAYIARYKYKVVCKDCGQEIYRTKKSKLVTSPQMFNCGICGGSLSVEVL